MNDQALVEAATEEEARAEATRLFQVAAKEEFSGCYGKRQRASNLERIERLDSGS